MFGSSNAQSITTALQRLGFQELYPLEAVPQYNARKIRYPAVVTARRDESRWCVRSYGTEFDLVDPSRRRLTGRWFSLGWGLGEDWIPVPELVLVQADGVDGEAMRELTAAVGALLGACGARWTGDADPLGPPARLRMAAVLAPVPQAPVPQAPGTQPPSSQNR